MPHTGAMVGATGIGSWPGHDVREALHVVHGELADAADSAEATGVQPLPYLPELPDRGPGADMLGRTAHLLIEMPVDLQPQGWRLTARPGMDADRTGAWWRQDLDELAEVFDGWRGRFKVQLTGPWTLAAGLWLPGGERVLSDPGAVRDLQLSLAEGVAEHVRAVSRLLPDASVVLQLDEPSLPTVLAGRVRSSSGYRALPAPESGLVRARLQETLVAARDAGAATTVVHCCAEQAPLPLLRGAGPDAVALDTTGWGPKQWESAAATVEAGVALWAGVLPAVTEEPAPAADVAASLERRWREVGLEQAMLAEVTLTPTCGLAGATPQRARTVTERVREAARALAELAVR